MVVEDAQEPICDLANHHTLVALPRILATALALMLLLAACGGGGEGNGDSNGDTFPREPEATTRFGEATDSQEDPDDDSKEEEGRFRGSGSSSRRDLSDLSSKDILEFMPTGDSMYDGIYADPDTVIHINVQEAMEALQGHRDLALELKDMWWDAIWEVNWTAEERSESFLLDIEITDIDSFSFADYDGGDSNMFILDGVDTGDLRDKLEDGNYQRTDIAGVEVWLAKAPETAENWRVSWECLAFLDDDTVFIHHDAEEVALILMRLSGDAQVVSDLLKWLRTEIEDDERGAATESTTPDSRPPEFPSDEEIQAALQGRELPTERPELPGPSDEEILSRMQGNEQIVLSALPMLYEMREGDNMLDDFYGLLDDSWIEGVEERWENDERAELVMFRTDHDLYEWTELMKDFTEWIEAKDERIAGLLRQVALYWDPDLVDFLDDVLIPSLHDDIGEMWDDFPPGILHQWSPYGGDAIQSIDKEGDSSLRLVRIKDYGTLERAEEVLDDYERRGFDYSFASDFDSGLAACETSFQRTSSQIRFDAVCGVDALMGLLLRT